MRGAKTLVEFLQTEQRVRRGAAGRAPLCARRAIGLHKPRLPSTLGIGAVFYRSRLARFCHGRLMTLSQEICSANDRAVFSAACAARTGAFSGRLPLALTEHNRFGHRVRKSSALIDLDIRTARREKKGAGNDLRLI